MAGHFIAGVLIFLLVVLPCCVVYKLGINAQWVNIASFFNATFLLTLILLSWINSRAYKKALNRLGFYPEKPEDLMRFASDLIKAGVSEGFVEELLFRKPSVLDRREVRRAIAVSLFIVYFTLLAYSLYYPIKLDSLTLLLSVVVAFYFGSRAVESGVSLYKARGKGKNTEKSSEENVNAV